MVVLDMLFSLVVSAIICLLFALLVWRGERRRGFVWFFITFFLATWAGGVWAREWGGDAISGLVLPFVIAGLLCALLLHLFTPRPPPIDKESQLDRERTLEMIAEIERRKELHAMAAITVNIFLWVLLALLFAAIVIHYL